MFWTIFFAILLTFYIIGALLSLGLLIANLEDHEDESTGSKIIIVAFGTLLSWITIGLFLNDRM